jgi:CelD/BcsL family acetyltransferase involved in cellulose biosynthesis
MRVSVVRPAELGADEAMLWAKFQQQSPVTQNPFLSCTFAQVVGRARPGARVAVVEDGGQIHAFLPFELGPRRIGLPIGSPMNDMQGLICSGAPLDARQVVRKAGLRGWRFINAPAEQAALIPHHYSGTAARCPVIDLSGGYPAYYASRSKSVTAEPARKRRALERDRGPVSLAWHTASPEYLRQMISWKSGQHYSLGRMFDDDRTALRIVAELTGTDNPDCQGVLSTLLAGDQPVAVSCNLVGWHGLSGWFTAYDPGAARFSPGMIMTFAIAEEAARRGITRLDLAPGPFAYKYRLANDSYPVAGGAVWAWRAEQAGRQLYRRFSYDRRHAAAGDPPL